LRQLKHVHCIVSWPCGQVTQSCRPQPGHEIRTRSGVLVEGAVLAMASFPSKGVCDVKDGRV
jgi:hypothetical protein